MNERRDGAIAVADTTTTEGSATADDRATSDERDRTDLMTECRFILATARDSGAPLRAMGGAAIALRCPATGAAPFSRRYKDIDFATRSGAVKELERLFADAGYTGDAEFNAINAHRRLIFWDPAVERKVDLFVDRVEMCHALDMRDRLELDADTLTLADLLLLKLQIVEATDKDDVDALALFADHPVGPNGIDGEYLAGLLAKDWGWWRTATRSLERLLELAATLPDRAVREEVESRIRRLLAQIEAAPKTRRWRMRARLGERVQWYELPEEVE